MHPKRLNDTNPVFEVSNMIEVEHLTKHYPGHRAIEDLNFCVEKGEIVGFLGPNGAGKSTTMRILSCFLSPTSGTARIAGFDIFEHSLEVRKRLGYLPENVPLYGEMRVKEYLHHRGALKGLSGKKLKMRVDAVQELTDIKAVERKLISKLSKGYRQRVGLAEALLHEPELLILDEPTIGLDPNQIRQVRELMKNLGQKHTLLLSTHILSEVEMICDRVIIIHRGKIAAIGTPEELPRKLRSAGNISLEVDTQHDEGVLELQTIPGIKEVVLHSPLSADTPTYQRYRQFSLHVEPGADPRAEIYQLAVDRHWHLKELSQKRATLEDVFVELTHSDHHLNVSL